MRAINAGRPPLRLVSKPAATIDADLVAFEVMEHIDTHFAAMWQAVPVGARASIRNAIIRAVGAQEANR